jgi:predicted Zn-dependent peptidase
MFFRGSAWILLLLLPAVSFGGIRVDRHVLDNGLQILLYPSTQAPTVVCRLFYTTGSVHERPGNTGIAHMLEHMLFKGTRKIGISDSVADAAYIASIDMLMKSLRKVDPEKDSLAYKKTYAKYDSLLQEQRKLIIKDELWETFLKEGGTSLNAFTTDLMTAYFVTLPKNKLELFLWLEADRMQNAVLREFYPERDVVMEERRMRYEDSPLGRYWETLNGMFYEAHPYRLPTIGYASDIRNYSRSQAEKHFRKYYKPNNAILVLAGDFEKKEALSLIRKYFAPIPRGEELAEIITRDPEPAGEKRLTVNKNDAKPRYDLMFPTPGIGHEDIYALDIVEGALSGKSGRLHRKLVKELKIATSASAGSRVNKYQSSFHISVQLGPEPQLEKVEEAVWEILEELKDKPISARELQRVKNQVAARSLRELRNLEHLATELAFYQMWGTWEYINIFPESVEKVTVEDVLEVCKKYFTLKRSTVGAVLSEEAK